MIQRPYFILYISLSSSYTTHTCICTVYIHTILILYSILYFYSVLYFNQKYIWSKPVFYTRLVSTILLTWRWTFQDITCVSRSGVTRMLKITKSSMRSGTYFILQTTCPKLFPLWHYYSLSSNPEGILSSWATLTMNQTETEKCDELTKLFYKQASLIIINIIEIFFNKNTSVCFKIVCFIEMWVPEHLPEHHLQNTSQWLFLDRSLKRTPDKFLLKRH